MLDALPRFVASPYSVVLAILSGARLFLQCMFGGSELLELLCSWGALSVALTRDYTIFSFSNVSGAIPTVSLVSSSGPFFGKCALVPVPAAVGCSQPRGPPSRGVPRAFLPSVGVSFARLVSIFLSRESSVTLLATATSTTIGEIISTMLESNFDGVLGWVPPGSR